MSEGTWRASAHPRGSPMQLQPLNVSRRGSPGFKSFSLTLTLSAPFSHHNYTHPWPKTLTSKLSLLAFFPQTFLPTTVASSFLPTLQVKMGIERRMGEPSMPVGRRQQGALISSREVRVLGWGWNSWGSKGLSCPYSDKPSSFQPQGFCTCCS